MRDWSFYFGPITFGGVYGEKIPLDEHGRAVISGLAPQKFRVGFAERMQAKWRHDVKLKPGQTTRLEFQLAETEELSDPIVRSALIKSTE